MSNMKIGMRLGLGFGVILLLVVIMGVIGMSRLENIHRAGRHMVDNALAQKKTAQAWLMGASINGTLALAMVKAGDEAGQDFFQQKMSAGVKHNDALKKTLEDRVSTDAEKAMFAEVARLRKVYQAIRGEILQLKRQGAQARANEQISARLVPSLDAYEDSIQAVLAYYEHDVALADQSINTNYESGHITMIIGSLIAVLLGTLIAWGLTGGITGPLREAVKVAAAVAEGDLTARSNLPPASDETGLLLAALGRMQENLMKIVKQIRQGTDSIATASTQIASGNLDLSSRTEQQASALTQTASSMEELTSTVRQNADNSEQAKQLAVDASDMVAKGGSVMSEVVNTMDGISTSSKKIVDIIDVIDGIAFQTNILALNAAVEAARAGEQGRGFAVVASEVRNLAQRSAAAAKEIKDLIDDSVEQVDVGSKLVVQAGSTMQEIVTGVTRVADIMAEITAASQEQSDGIGQVNQAISQMDQVTQQNAALVEEAAAAADSLQHQARTLTQAVSVFRIDTGAGVGRAHASVAYTATQAAATPAASARSNAAFTVTRAQTTPPAPARPASRPALRKPAAGSAKPVATSAPAKASSSKASPGSTEDWEEF